MKKNQTSIVFTGDIGFDRYMSGRWTDENLLSKGICDFFHSADHVVANVEGALLDTTGDVTGRGVYFHAMDPAAAAFLRDIRADIWNIGNNHIMDAAHEGLTNTKKVAAEMGVRTIGAGENIEDAATPVYLDEAGGIGMFGIAYMPECIPATKTEPGNFSWDEFERIENVIKEIKKTCRWCILVIHGSEEFASIPMPYIRGRYLKYLDMGADIIVAHHPHVPQNYETFPDGKAIFYSLGNFIFDTDYQRAQFNTDHGILLRLKLDEKDFDFDAMGIDLIRGEERLVEGELPAIFTDISAEEYELLAPLSAQGLVAAEYRRMKYLEPDKYCNATEEEWNAYFDSDQIEDYIKDQYMDFVLIRSYIREGGDSWKKSRLDGVIGYIVKQL